MKKHSSKKSKSLPLVGSITYYLPIRNGRPCTDGLTGELRRIVEAEISVVRGEFAGMDRFYSQIDKGGRNFLTAAGIALFGAVGTDDPQLFDEVLADIASPLRSASPLRAVDRVGFCAASANGEAFPLVRKELRGRYLFGWISWLADPTRPDFILI